MILLEYSRFVFGIYETSANTLKTIMAAVKKSGNESRDSWSNNFGFIMAAAGAAVGLGNIWRFPYVCGENGGGAFIIAYVGCVILIGMPVLWSELAIGRASGEGSGIAFIKILKQKSKLWRAVGLLGVLMAFLITSYYTIIAGWTLEYLFQSFTGTLSSLNTAELSSTYFNNFMDSFDTQIMWHIAFTVITAAIVLGGVSGGIEKAAEVLMPILLIILVSLAIFGIFQEASIEGTAWLDTKSMAFLFTPNWEAFTMESFFKALGQAAFSLSIAVGTMITYGSYLDKKENIAGLGSIVVFMDTLVALLGGLVIFPIVFAFGLNPEAGASLIFITLPTLFAKIPMGGIVAPVFYMLLFFAALTSSISLLEPAVTYLIDELKQSRKMGTFIAGGASALLGVYWIVSRSLEQEALFKNIDKLISDLLIPVEAVAITVFAGWLWKQAESREEFKQAPDWIYGLWRFMCRWVCPIAVTYILVQGLQGVQLF